MTADAETAQLLRAGGLAPVGAAVPGDDPVDPVVARAYPHPVMPGRTVVRLAAQTVAVGDDLEMAVLGFGPGSDRGPVAQERRRSLGFPGWCLVHDPNNARYALDVVGELKRHARTARTRPSIAKDGIDAIAARLGKTVPQFLPSFFEEAGRAFLAHGATSFAATMFARAREAEAVHALAIDEAHRRTAFLEFALAGAVTTKALTEYAKDLAAHHAPAEAYAHFRQLCVQRTLGGMPPWAGMAKDLRRLAKAAGRDPDEEDRAFVEDIIQSPALAKAAAEFWRSYGDAIVALAQRAPRVRGVLLDLFPTGTPDIDDAWLDLLEASGAIAALIHDDVPAEARSSLGRAAWLDKLFRHVGRRGRDDGARVFGLLRRMAPQLVADGAAITAMRWQLDLDLAELALELGVAVQPPATARLVLDQWATTATKPEHGRDPVRAATHPVLGPLLAGAIGAVLGKPGFEAAARDKRGFVAAKRAWLEGQLAKAEAGGLPALDAALDAIDTQVRATTFAELPDLHARFAALDAAAALARSLRAGVLDEFGWPALEAAAAELSPDGQTTLTVHGGLPAAIVASPTRAIAVAPRARLGAHDVVIPVNHELVTLRFIQGQFLVVLKKGYQVRGYWSSAPHDVFDLNTSLWNVERVAPRACVRPDGAWLERAQVLRAGDRTWPDGKLAASDGATVWLAQHEVQADTRTSRTIHREVSATGEPGRASWAAFLEAGLGPEWFVDGQISYVLPAPDGPDGLDASPLGLAEGRLGLRARYRGTAREPTARDATRIDGATWAGPARAIELLTLPDGGLRPVLATDHARATITVIADGDGQPGSNIGDGDRRYWRGAVAAYPRALWHALVARDVAGSRRLRAVTADDARGLTAALAGQTFEQLAEAVPVELIHGALPELTAPRLVRGVAGMVALAAQLAARQARLVRERAPGAAPTVAAPTITGPDDAEVKRVLGGWIESHWGRSNASAQIAHIAAWFASGDRSDRALHHDLASSLNDSRTNINLTWQPFAVLPGALRFLARGIAVADDARGVIAGFAALLGQLPAAGRLRYLETNLDDHHSGKPIPAGLALFWRNGNAYAVTSAAYPQHRYRVLEYAPDGGWQPLPQLVITREVRPVAMASGPGPAAAWTLADAPGLAERTGLTASEAVFLLAGCPNASNRSANFLDKPVREALGLKAAQAQVARDALNAIPLHKRLAVIARAGDTVDSVAAAWNAEVGRRVAVPEDVITEADREVEAMIGPSVALAMIADADHAPGLNVDVPCGLDGHGDVIQVEAAAPLVGQTAVDQPGFNAQALHTMASYLPFLAAALPVGDPLRARAPIAYARLLERLAAPSLRLPIGTISVDASQRAGFDAVIQALGGQDLVGLAEGCTGRALAGGAIVRRTWTYGTPPVEAVRLQITLHPATANTPAAAGFLQLARQVAAYKFSTVRDLELVRSADFAAMMRRITETPVPAGGWEQDPRLAAPAIVARAQATLGLGPDAAALYLQYLTLLAPTTKQLLRWNGWKPKQLAAASAELVARGLVIEAKRERAQRGHFLPGGWEALKAPHPPFESWKLPLYGARAAGGGVSSPLPRFAALAPFHLLFERAWARISAGDVPKYEDVKR